MGCRHSASGNVGLRGCSPGGPRSWPASWDGALPTDAGQEVWPVSFEGGLTLGPPFVSQLCPLPSSPRKFMREERVSGDTAYSSPLGKAFQHLRSIVRKGKIECLVGLEVLLQGF